ncbi:hypothetical protein [Streptomyces sp. NPDC052225]|uniref:hypothetical protein n=1 Tax=Streptomyces sp. NPDC052225 TaxID=3154949 RepID=UPI00342C67C5
MSRRITIRAVLVGATMTAMAAAGAGTAGAAESTVFTCHAFNAVCISSGDVLTPDVVVEAGQNYTFDTATTVDSVSNDTTLTYCVRPSDSEWQITVLPGQTYEGPRSVDAVTVTEYKSCPV